MSQALCINGCTYRGKHLDGCPETTCTQPVCDKDHCRGCEPRPLRPGTILCHACANHLEMWIVDTPGIYLWLNVYLPPGSRPRPHTPRTGHTKHPEPQIGLDPDIHDARIQLEELVYGWLADLTHTHKLAGPETTTLAAACHYLRAHYNQLLTLDELPLIYEEFNTAITTARQLVDWRPERKRIKDTDCPNCAHRTLFIEGGEELVHCSRCHSSFDQARYGIWARTYATKKGHTA